MQGSARTYVVLINILLHDIPVHSTSPWWFPECFWKAQRARQKWRTQSQWHLPCPCFPCRQHTAASLLTVLEVSEGLQRARLPMIFLYTRSSCSGISCAHTSDSQDNPHRSVFVGCGCKSVCAQSCYNMLEYNIRIKHSILTYWGSKHAFYYILTYCSMYSEKTCFVFLSIVKDVFQWIWKIDVLNVLKDVCFKTSQKMLVCHGRKSVCAYYWNVWE